MKKIRIIISFLIGTTTFNSCEKITDTTWVYYDETKCFDPWGLQDNVLEKGKKENIKKYLKDKKIKVFEIKIFSDGIAEACKACHCKNGNRIHVEIRKKDVSKIINEGFYQ